MIHHFDHRFATYERDGTIRDTTLEEHQDPTFAPMPRYWVEESEVEERLVKRDRDGNVIWRWEEPWLLGFRDITNATNERTAIFSLIPRGAVGHTMPVCLLSEVRPSRVLAFTALTSSLIFDYMARQAVGGTHMTFFIVRQLPAPRPEQLQHDSLAWLIETTRRLLRGGDGMAMALGPASIPNSWMTGERAITRAAVDAYFMSLYGLDLHDAEYVLDTFEGLSRRDVAMWGERRTRRLVLEAMRERPWASRSQQPDCDQGEGV